MEFDFSFGRSGSKPSRRAETEPMRLLVIGDFSGQTSAARTPLAGRPAQRVDTDNLRDVLRRWRPMLDEIVFETLEDFHPDRLYSQLDGFKSMRDARVAPVSADEEIGRLLGKPAQSRPAAQSPASPLDAMIRNIVQPHIVKDDSAQRQPYEAAVNAATSDRMRALLHRPDFQALESTWRGVHWLTSSLELDENLQLHLFDVARAELGDLAAIDMPGGKRWTAFVALFTFSTSEDDLATLSALGTAAAKNGAVLLAGGDLSMVSDDSAAAARWAAVRRSAIAPAIGVAAPRVLLRLPYGKRTDPIASFPFEEFAGDPVHEEFVWGPASLATALVAGRTFLSTGWDMEADEERHIDDMPAYTFTRDGEKELQACAEQYLSERELDRLMNAGVMPVASRRDRNAVVLIRFQSIADPPAPLTW